MTDILIIGGGIAGISAAARLAPLGQVTVLEAEDGLGYHASGRSAAMFEETYGLPSTITLNRASKAYHMEANGGVLSPRGLMLVGTSTDEDAFAHDLRTMAMTRMPLDEGRALVPILDPEKVTQVGHHAEAWDIDTDRLIQNFAREARAHGATIHLKTRVTDIHATDTGWRVETTTGNHSAKLIVNAAGAWADHIAHLAHVQPIRLQPYRRSMARIPAPGGHDVSNWPMLFGPGETWYAKPDAGKLLVSPADEDPVEPHDAWADDMVLAHGLARYEAVVTEPVTRVEASWAGLRSFAPDRNLVIGFAPENPRFFWLAGQGGYGMQTSPAVSQLAADLIAGRPSNVDAATVKALDPARLI